MWSTDRIIVVLSLVVGPVSSFHCPQVAVNPVTSSQSLSTWRRQTHTKPISISQERPVPPLFAAKGFGNTPSSPPPSSKKSKKISSPSSQTTSPQQPPTSSISPSDTAMLENGYNPFIDESSEQQQDQPTMSQGKAALDRLRRERAEQKNEELRKMKEVREIDEMLRDSPEAAAIPEKVAQRMGARMLPFVGIPLFGAMGSFVGFWYMATYRDMEFQPALVATVSLVLLAVGLVGITYSIMSASWDPDREGSFFGTDEFSQNLGNVRQGLSRSRENAVLRDKMDRSPMTSQEEMDRLVNKVKEPKKSFAEKMGDEMK